MQATLNQPTRALVAVAYCAAALLTGALWLGGSSVCSTVAGGVFGGLLLGFNYKGLGSRKSSWVFSLLQALASVVVVVAWMFKQTTAPDDWEPSKLQSFVGPVAFGVTYLAAVYFTSSKSDSASVPAPTAAVSEAAAARLRTPWTWAHRAAFTAALVAGVAAQLSVHLPSVFAPASFAAQRYVEDNIYNLPAKSGLDFDLAEATETSVKTIEVNGSTATATIEVHTPIVPFLVPSDKWGSRVYSVKWEKLPQADMKRAIVTGQVEFTKTLMGGWTPSGKDNLLSQIAATRSGVMPKLTESAPADGFDPIAVGLATLMWQFSIPFSVMLLLLVTTICLAGNPHRSVLTAWAAAIGTAAFTVGPMLTRIWL